MLDLAIRIDVDGAGTAAGQLRLVENAVKRVETTAKSTETPIANVTRAITGTRVETDKYTKATVDLETVTRKLIASKHDWMKLSTDEFLLASKHKLLLGDLHERQAKLDQQVQQMSRSTLPGMISAMGLTTTGAIALGASILGVVAAGAAWITLLGTSASHYFQHSEDMKANRDALDDLSDAWDRFKMTVGEAVLGDDFSIVKPIKLLEVGLMAAADWIAVNIDRTQRWIDLLARVPGAGPLGSLARGAQWMFSNEDDATFLARPQGLPVDNGMGADFEGRAYSAEERARMDRNESERYHRMVAWEQQQLKERQRERERQSREAERQRREREALQARADEMMMAPWYEQIKPRETEQVNLANQYGVRQLTNAELSGWDFSKWAPEPISLQQGLQNYYGTVTPFGVERAIGGDPDKFLQGYYNLGKREPGVFGSLFGGMTTPQFGAQIGSSVLGAIQGGGSIPGAIGGTLGMSAGSSIARMLTSGGGINIGGFAGGALNAILPGAGALLGPAMDWLGGQIGKLFGPTEYEKRERQAAKDISGMTSGIEAQFGGYEGAKAVADAMGIQWDHTKSMQGGGSVDAVRQQVERIANGSTKALNDILSAALTTGKAFPAALQPALESLIQMGGLTQENANLLRGLPAAGVPSMAEIEAAAATLGVSVGALGDKVKQIGLTETAEEAAQAWLTLERAGADMTVVAQGAAEQMQGYVDQALEYGFTLPESLRPAIEHMRELGLISGDIEQIEWAKPLTDSVADLVLALRDLVATMRGDVTNAINEIDGREINVGVNVQTRRGEEMAEASDPWIYGEENTDRTAHTGGYLDNGKVFPFGGTYHDGGMLPDEFFIKAQSREFVMNRDAVQHYGKDFMHAVNQRQLRAPSGEGGVQLMSFQFYSADGRKQAEEVVRFLPGAKIKYYGSRR